MIVHYALGKRWITVWPVLACGTVRFGSPPFVSYQRKGVTCKRCRRTKVFTERERDARATV